MAGRPKKYTAAEFEAAVGQYFRSILRTEVMTERVTVMEDGVPVEHVMEIRNDEGEPMMRERWLRPPSVSGLCLALGIDRSTWQNYASKKRNPRHAPVCAEAKMRIECYLEELLSTKEKSVQGIIFNLEHNYWRQGLGECEEEQQDSAIEGMSMREKLELIRRTAGVSEDSGETEPERN